MKRLKKLFLASIAVICLSLSLTAQTDNVSGVYVLNADGNGFPTVSASVRVVSNSGQAVTGLTSNDFSIDTNIENYDLPTLQALPSDGGLNTVIVLDRSAIATSEITLYRDILTQFASVAYRNGDNLWLMTIRGSDPVRVNNADEVNRFVSQINFNDGSTPTQVGTALDLAVNTLLPFVNNKENAQIVLIGSYLSNNPVTYTGRDKGIPLHVLHAHAGTRGGNAGAFQAMATGAFLSLTRITSELTTFFNTVNSNRTLYTVTYNSRTATVGVRNVPLLVRGVRGNLQYQADVYPPQVEIVRAQSSDNTVIRNGSFAEGTTDSNPVYNFDKLSEELTVRVTFPSPNNSVASASLVVNGVTQPTSQIAMNSANEFSLVWDVSQYQQDSTAKLAVTVTDYYNQTVRSSDREFAVKVNLPELADVCYINGVLRPKEECSQIAETAETATNVATVSLATNVGLVGVAVVLGVLLFWQRKNVEKAVVGASQVFTQGAQKIGSATAVAVSNIFGGATRIEGDDNSPAGGGRGGGTVGVSQVPPGQRFVGDPKKATEIEANSGYTNVKTPVKSGSSTQVEDDSSVSMPVPPMDDMTYATFMVRQSSVHVPDIRMKNPRLSIGRDEEHGADVIVPMPSISRLHCEIVFEHDKRQFYILDKDSANGTYINNQRLASREKRLLAPNDTVRLGKNDALILAFVPNPSLMGTGVKESNTPKRKVTGRLTLIEEDEDETPSIKQDTGIISGTPAPIVPVTPVPNLEESQEVPTHPDLSARLSAKKPASPPISASNSKENEEDWLN